MTRLGVNGTPRDRLHAGFSDQPPPNRFRPISAMLRYDTDQTPQKWSRADLLGVAAIVFVILCIWAVISWRHYEGDETQHQLTQARAQLAEAKEKGAALASRLADT